MLYLLLLAPPNGVKPQCYWQKQNSIAKLHILVNFKPDFLKNRSWRHLDTYTFVFRAIRPFQWYATY